MAEESLRLRTQDNDLAAFVVIVARCAGAVGSLASIPSPRAHRLPESLRGHLAGVLAEIRSPEPGEPRRIGEHGEPRDGRFSMAAVAFVVVVLALASVYVGFWVNGRREPSTVRVDSPPSPGLPAAPATGAPVEPDTPDNDGEEALSRAVDEGWIDAGVVAQTAYRRGRSRSRSGLYDGAAADFGIARRFGDGYYFYDDATYYQARALHRSGSLPEAQEAYEHLLSLSTDERLPYRADAKRFLEQLRNRRAEGQVAR